MTEKVFWQDPYLTALDTRVAGVGGDDVTLERTIFYALSGGQESDEGTIGGVPVLQARKLGREIRYTLKRGHGLKAGDPVTVAIDWVRRYRLMRLHFAAEIVLELAYRELGPITKIGAHIAADKARIDFAWKGKISETFPALMRGANAIVRADHPIDSGFSDEANEKRYWQIPDFDPVPCGGTHLRRTGEVGAIVLKRRNIGRGKERVEIHLAGDGAR